MADDILQEVTEDEIPKILEALKKDWPKHFLLHQHIKISEEYKKNKLEFPEQALYRYGNIEDGVYLVQTKFPNKIASDTYYFVYTTSTDLTDLSRVMMQTSRVPWHKKKILFELTMSQFAPVVDQAFESRGVNIARKHNIMYRLPPEDEINYRELPEDMYLDYLDASHAPEVNRNWPHKYPGSEEYLSQQIMRNFGLGLFRKSDKRMVCSVLQFQSGVISALYSDPEFRGKGYAEILIQNMVKEIRKQGNIAFATIVPENIPSINLFKKIGFKEFARGQFIFPFNFFK